MTNMIPTLFVLMGPSESGQVLNVVPQIQKWIMEVIALISRVYLLSSVNEPAHSIGKQHIHFVWFYNGCHFAFTKHCMHQGLSLAIRTGSVIRRTGGIRGLTY